MKDVTFLPAGSGQALVRVTASINPREASIGEGKLAQQFRTTFPCGEGTDFAGVIEIVGDGVTTFSESR